MPTKTEAIKAFLTRVTHKDLADLYNHDMEVQVNVAQDSGERYEGEYKGKKWQGWTDATGQIWKPIRIPYKAKSEPEYTDGPINFDLAAHVDAIGMTGWDWKARLSRWVAFDFDAIIGHSDKHTKKLTQEQMEAVRKAACSLDFVTVRKSTAGRGLHLYIFLEPVITANHTEHAALARSILGMMSAITGFDFVSKVDVCGGNMWVWGRKMAGTDGLTLVKQGTVLSTIPAGWRDHVKVISGARRKNLPQDIEAAKTVDQFDELCGQNQRIQLDEEHQALINCLKDMNALWWWDQDNHMLVTHTVWLKKAHDALGMRGIFETASAGKDLNVQNCYAFPLRKGAWTVRRFGQGVQEHTSWSQDSSGWTRCYLNRDPDFASAAKAHGGVEDPKGGFIFYEAEQAMKAAQSLNVQLDITGRYAAREAKLDLHKDGRLVIMIERDDKDNPSDLPGWLPKKDKWIKIANCRNTAAPEPEVGNYDDMCRHIVTTAGDDNGWMIKSDGQWRNEPLTHIKLALQSNGIQPKDVVTVCGNAILRAWKLVNKPFAPEYPGDREWNRNSAQLRFAPTPDAENLSYPTWGKILTHVGQGLNGAVAKNPWCKANGIITGADYLKCWICSLIKEPNQPLPYLFFYSQEQNNGKSSFHEAINLLLTKGVARGESALTNQQGFCGELDGAILCVVEEIDLRQNKTAYNRIKDWVTAREIAIVPKGGTPYQIANTTHWVQCSNDQHSCPVFTNDSRIVMVKVPKLSLTEMIPRKQLISQLEKEAPDFLSEILNIELPVSPDRLNIPVIETEEKEEAQRLSKDSLQLFLEEKCKHVPGSWVSVANMWEAFFAFLDPVEKSKWSKTSMNRQLPEQFKKGRNPKDCQFYIGNIEVEGVPVSSNPGHKYVIVDGYLRLEAV